MTSDELARAFDRFWRLRARLEPAPGLRLAIVVRHVHADAGEIELRTRAQAAAGGGSSGLAAARSRASPRQFHDLAEAQGAPHLGRDRAEGGRSRPLREAADVGALWRAVTHGKRAARGRPRRCRAVDRDIAQTLFVTPKRSSSTSATPAASSASARGSGSARRSQPRDPPLRHGSRRLCYAV